MPSQEDKKSSIMNSTIDVKWLVTLLVPFIAWCISIEVRMSSGLPQRVTNLEVALQPVLIDYGVDKELEARGIKVPGTSPIATVPPLMSPAPAPAPRPPRSGSPRDEEIKKLRAEEEAKLREQFPNAYNPKK